MSKPIRARQVDPVKATEQFKADLAAMQVGPKDGKGAIQQRQHDKNFGLGSFKFNRWSAELDEAQTLEQALEPTFWTGQVDTIMGQDKSKPRGRGDIIEVRKADSGLYAELLVIEIGKGFVKVKLIARAEPEAVEVPAKSALTTRWNAGAKTHDVIRKADGQVMRGGFQTKATAAAWIADHIKAMAA
jgi:hypothetical protein